MKKFERFRSGIAVLNRDDVDTDQIIPARFLTTTERGGLGAHLFEDWRYDAGGQARTDFVLNRPESLNTQILLGGQNFGCGSSREHAVWALMDYGFRTVIATGFADIFRKNSLRNGLLTISVNPAIHSQCLEIARKGRVLDVDLSELVVRGKEGWSFSFEVDPFARKCMLEGVDDLEYILRHANEIGDFEKSHTTS